MCILAEHTTWEHLVEPNTHPGPVYFSQTDIPRTSILWPNTQPGTLYFSQTHTPELYISVKHTPRDYISTKHTPWDYISTKHTPRDSIPTLRNLVVKGGRSRPSGVGLVLVTVPSKRLPFLFPVAFPRNLYNRAYSVGDLVKRPRQQRRYERMRTHHHSVNPPPEYRN